VTSLLCLEVTVRHLIGTRLMWFVSQFLCRSWWLPVALFVAALSILVLRPSGSGFPVVPVALLALSLIWLLIWASYQSNSSREHRLVAAPRQDVIFNDSELIKVRLELDARIREAAAFKAELEAKHAEIAALKSGLNRTDAAELNEAIAQLFIDLEFERGRAEGDSAQILAGLLDSVNGLFTAAALVKGAPTPGERFVDQPAGSCKVFKTELTSDVALKGTIKAVRSPWVGFMANGKLKIITASNISVYA
jgi:hypothetical protein